MLPLICTLRRSLHASADRTLLPPGRSQRRPSTRNGTQAQEETGWKLVHGDVFRAPKNPNLLSVLVGSGVQLLAMVVITLSAQHQ